jgi:anti-sigma factor RsiW
VRQPVQRCRSVSCSRARRELLEHFALGEELGPRSGPHLAHLESCADCRREVGIDRQVVQNLRRALRERVEGGAPSEASWELVRRRTVDRPVRPWTVRVVHWGGMVSAAAAAGIMMFAVATAPETRLFPGTESPFVASAARRAVPPVEDAIGWPPAPQGLYVAPQTDAPLPGQRMQLKMAGEAATRDGEPPIPGLR